MKKFVISYIFISILFAISLYVITLTLSYNERIFDVFHELSSEAVLTKDFDSFVSYQSIKYYQISKHETNDYIIFVYHIIGSEKESYTNQLGIFVLPTENVIHALVVDDKNDQTHMKIIDINLSSTIYDTSIDEEFNNFAVSYGIEKIGYYFYTYNLSKDMELKIELYNYQGDMLFENTYIFNYQDYPDVSSMFTDGISQEELQIMIDQETYVYPKIIKNMTIYIIIDVLLGSALYFLIRYKRMS